MCPAVSIRSVHHYRPHELVQYIKHELSCMHIHFNITITGFITKKQNRHEPSYNINIYIYIYNYLVGGLEHVFPYIGNNSPNWLILFRGVETTNQLYIYNFAILWAPSCTPCGFVSAVDQGHSLVTAARN